MPFTVKPIHEKPTLGKPPSYLTNDEGRPALPTIGKYNSLRTALTEAKPTVSFCRTDFLDAAIGYADRLRIRQQPDLDKFDERVLSDLHAMLPLRDQLIDWLLIETSLPDSISLEPLLVNFLERLLALKYKPEGLSAWNEDWFDAHRIFVYETFLYLIAVLIKADCPGLIRELLTTHFLLPDSEARSGMDFVTFAGFNTRSGVLEDRNTRLQLQRISPIADLVKERATRSDIPFSDIMQADLVILLVAILEEEGAWNPHSLVYSGYGRPRFPLFVRAARHKDFNRLRIISGAETGDELRQKFKEKYEQLRVNHWRALRGYGDVSFWQSMNMEALDTLD